MRLRLFVAGLAATGLVVFPLLAPARGGSGGMGSGSSGHGQSHGGNYLSPFWSPGCPGPGRYEAQA
jgi:hypothetical protein